MNPTERINQPIIPSSSNSQATERVTDIDIISTNAATPSGTERIDAPIIAAGGVASVISASQNSNVTLGNVTYQIHKLLARSGEADVYLIESEQKKVVWKLYHQDFKPKQEIVDNLKRMKSNSIMLLLGTGDYNGHFYELNEYMAGGTLDDLKPLTNADRLKEVIRQVNEALHFCHQNRIIHRDIKPQNIFFRDAGRSEVVLGDFGISSQLDAGASSRVTTRTRTSLYAAPELFTEIQGKTTLGIEVDYYALGVTILEVWDEKNPFGTDMEHNMMRAKTGGRFLMPAGMPASFNSLVKGLLTPNYENRWGYEQVAAWTRGEPNIPLKFAALFDYKPYLLGKRLGLTENSTIDSPEAMGMFIEKNKKIGIELLYGNKISQWIYAAGDSEKADQITDVVEKDYPRDQDAGIMEAIFILNPECSLMGHDGVTKLEDFGKIATYFEMHATHYQTALKVFSNDFYAFLMALDIIRQEDETTGAITTIDYKAKARKYHGLFQNRSYTPEKALNTIILDLQNGELILGKDQIHFVKMDEFVTVTNPDFQQDVIKQFIDSDSKTVIWLETNHPALASQVMRWRRTGRCTQSTLGYALGVHGYRLENREADSVEQFLMILVQHSASFFTHADANSNREEADYWLKNYQNNSLSQVILQALKLQQIGKEYLIKSIQYILAMYQEAQESPYTCAENALRASEPIFGQHQAILSFELADILSVFYADQISDSAIPKKAVTHLEQYEMLANHMSQLPDVFQTVMKDIMNQLSSTIENGIHHDFVNQKKSDKSFLAYYDRVDQFIGKQLAESFPEMPLQKNWQKRQQLLLSKTGDIVNNLIAQKQSKLRENQQNFVSVFQQATEETQKQCEVKLATPNYHGNVAKFYRAKGRTLLLIVGGLSVVPLGNFIGTVILWVFVLWDSFENRVSIPAPALVTRQIGKWLYKPIVSGAFQFMIDSKQDSPYKRTMDTYETTNKKIETHFAGLEIQETFVAKRAVFLLHPQQL